MDITFPLFLGLLVVLGLLALAAVIVFLVLRQSRLQNENATLRAEEAAALDAYQAYDEGVLYEAPLALDAYLEHQRNIQV